jgi:hypothetical protein
MLLESPSKRFDYDTLRWKRHMAQAALKDKLFKSDRSYRDECYGIAGVHLRKQGRKEADYHIKMALQVGLKDLELAAKLLKKCNGAHGIDSTSLSRIFTKRFGFNVRDQVILNHKREWIDPVWQNESWFKDSSLAWFHDVHQSEEDPSQIAYNRNIDNIKRNIQTRTKPGKYLTQFFSDVLDQDEIRYWAQKQLSHANCRGELKFIENNDEAGWIRVYRNGPHSCMRGSDSVRVYAREGNGLRLAYIESEESIVARCIVVDAGHNDDGIQGWLRIYSTDQRWDTTMRTMLSAAGYDERTNMNGIKLQLIEDNGQYQCPYIDYGSGGDQTVEVNTFDDYLLCGHGDIEATNTGGWVGEGEYCDECEEHVSGETTHVDSTERNVCQCCLDHHYTYAYGHRYQDWFPNDDVIYCESNDNYYHEESYSNHGIVYLEDRNEYYHEDDCICIDVGQYEGDWIHADDACQDHISDEQDHSCRFESINGKWVHESYVVIDYVTGGSVDMRECVQIYVGRKHKYAYSDFYKEDIHLYIHQDNLTAEVILSDFVKCGDNLYRNTCYGNPVTCFEPENVIYGDEYTGDKIEDHLVANAEERLAA